MRRFWLAKLRRRRRPRPINQTADIYFLAICSLLLFAHAESKKAKESASGDKSVKNEPSWPKLNAPNAKVSPPPPPLIARKVHLIKSLSSNSGRVAFCRKTVPASFSSSLKVALLVRARRRNLLLLQCASAFYGPRAPSRPQNNQTHPNLQLFGENHHFGARRKRNFQIMKVLQTCLLRHIIKL